MTNKKTNYIAIALDVSGSMGDVRDDTLRAYNDMLQTIKERAEAEKQETFLSLIFFESKVKVEHYLTDVRSVKPLVHYPILGQTALFDGVGQAVEVLDRGGEASDEDRSQLVLVFTDGEENNSYKYNPDKIKKLIQSKQATDKWTFAFQMPPGKGAAFARRYGIPEDNIREWERTTAGVRELAVETTAGITSFFSARSVGATSVKNFYKVTTDLSAVSKQDILKKLVDISVRFKSYTVDKECSVSAFAEVKTGRPYIIGSTYYQLMKPEKVQSDKGVLIVEKGKKVIYGGDAARLMIGLPSDADAKVVPGNHSDYDIYVESRSVNRKLPRGTKVLIDITQTVNKASTWDHTAVSAANGAIK